MARIIIGIGDAMRGDDAVGLIAAQRLRALLQDNVSVLQHAREGTSLIGLWQRSDDVTLIDAVISGAPPGTIHEQDLLANPLPPNIGAATTHTLGVQEGVELERALGVMPASLLFIGIEGSDFELAHGLSHPVERALERVVASLASQ